MAEPQATTPGLEILRVQPRRRGQVARLLRWTIGGILAVVLAAGIGFVSFAQHVSTLSTPANPEPADAIIVLTGGLYRLDAGVDLLKSGKGARLLISGVNPSAGRDDLREATGGDKRLFSCCVDIDHAALDTIGNAEESAKWINVHHYRSVILVTNNYHMPRSLLEMRRFLRDAEIRPYPVVNTILSDGTWLTKPDALRVIATEYAKYLAALARGFTGSTGSTAFAATSGTD